MRNNREPRSALLLGAAVMGMAAALVLGLAAPALAHNYRISSTPEPGATLTSLPSTFDITTNGLLLDIDGDGTGFALEVRDAGGGYYGDGCIVVTGASMTTAAQLGEAGIYTVTWQAISTDGHTISDEYKFTWQPPQGLAASTPSPAAPDCNGAHPVNAEPQKKDSLGTADDTSQATNSGSVSSGPLETVLWIGGAGLALALAVILTLVFTTKRREQAKD